jgi:DNA-directed RNA polymerase specialized sigma24 family protein
MTFEEFAATRLPALLRFAAVLAGDRATAEDLSQEVLARAYAGWDRIGGMDRPDLYVRKMILNEFLSWRRRSWRLVPAADAGAGQASAVPDYAYQHSERAALLAEISKLPGSSARSWSCATTRTVAIPRSLSCWAARRAPSGGYASRGLAALRIELRPQQPAEPAPAGEDS